MVAVKGEQMNRCEFFGRLTSDPDVRYSPTTQKAVVNFSIAVKREVKNKEGKYDTDFFNCIAFDKRGEMIGNNFSKGSRICVWGQMRQEKWQDKEGNNHTTYKLYLEGFEFVDSTKERAVSVAKSVGSTLDNIGEEVDF